MRSGAPPPNPYTTNAAPAANATTSAKSGHLIDETTSIIEIAPTTLHSLGLLTQGARSRSGPLRACGAGAAAVRSASGAVRAGASAGTMASFSLLPRDGKFWFNYDLAWFFCEVPNYTFDVFVCPSVRTRTSYF